ncbi:hypothetical protein K0M31_011175 [Melipona bicolor]|uniref:Uncharacterized protein n=1 Tax=Melipona bicolor TaxID=60889 RepID=A0AA40G914_9HYME|nr:hypothetical protein K0M31_011175 [Melipona bicolor]
MEWYKQSKKKAGKSRKERKVVGEVAMSSNLHNVSCFFNYTRQDVGVAVHLGRSYLYNHIQETFAPATAAEDGNGSWRTKRMWDVVLSTQPNTLNAVIFGTVIVSFVMPVKWVEA